MSGIRRLLTVRRRRREDLAAIRAAAASLRPGLWLAAGVTTWRRAGVALPEHLRRTKGFEAHAPARGAVRRLGGRLLHAVLMPTWFWNARGGHDGYVIAVVAEDRGLVLLDPARGRVERSYGAEPISEAYESLRRRFERHVPAPRFSVKPDRRSIVEQFVVGEHLLDLPSSDRLVVVRDLFRRYTDLVRHEGEGSSTDHVVPAVERALGCDLPGDLRALLADVDVATAAPGWPLVPSATDAHVKNVMAVDRRTCVPLDLAQLRLEPFFSYPVGVVTLARPVVLDAYLDGSLDEELEGLFDAAGAALPRTPHHREALLALRIVMTACRAATRDGSFSATVLSRVVQTRWRAVTRSDPATYR